ncbi:MAG: 4a-hydroxytetrahydrobiopterin dehydratase [bacterium]|nr:4a-hydroxytetrahydrobiopterin dehydratase [bacterium]
MPPLGEGEVASLLRGCPSWRAVEGRKIVREFTFADFGAARRFLDMVAVVADEEGHHPAMTLSYGKLKVTLTTHAAGGLTRNDFIMARIIDSMEA